MTTSTHKNTLKFIVSTLVFFFGFATFTYAAPFTPLVSIPGLTDSGTSDLPTYINKVYLLIITIGALFGVVKIAFAGVKYSMSDVVSSKQSAKDDIKGVLIGLGILLIPFMVLNTINPELTRLDVLSGARKIQLKDAPKPNSPTMTPVLWESDKTAKSTTQRSCENTVGSVWDTSVSPAVCKTATQLDSNKLNTTCSNPANKYYDPNAGICKSTLSSSGLNEASCKKNGGVWKQFTDGLAPYYNCANPRSN